jgi:hypothetical protein
MSYGDHSSGLRSTGACITHGEQIDLSTIDRFNVEQRLNLIEILYRTGYLPWGREQVAREIKENKKMVRRMLLEAIGLGPTMTTGSPTVPKRV